MIWKVTFGNTFDFFIYVYRTNNELLLMTIPVRCYSCGKVTGNKWEPYQKLLSEGVSIKDALDKLGLTRMCCRRILMCHVNLVDKVMSYSDYKDCCDVSQVHHRESIGIPVIVEKPEEMPPDLVNDLFEQRLAELRV